MTLQQEYDNAVNEMNASKLDVQVTMQALRAEFLEYVQAAVKKTGMQDKIVCQYAEPDYDVDDMHEIKCLADIHDDDGITGLDIEFMLADNGNEDAMLNLQMYACLDDGKFSLMPFLNIDDFFTNGHDDYTIILEFMYKFASQFGMITKHANSKKFMSMLQTIIDYAKTCVKAEELKKDCVTDNVLRLKVNDVVNMGKYNCCKVTRCTSRRVYFKNPLGNEFFYSKNEIVDAIMQYGWKIVHKS